MAKFDTRKNIDQFLKVFAVNDLALAIGLLTRLPIREADWSEQDEPTLAKAARAVWAYPLAGLAVGLIAVLVGWVLGWLGLPTSLVAAGVLITLIIATGAMHEDGLADCADGFWGAWDFERRLEIMKDSHIGAYGVIALVISLLMRWAALNVLIAAGSLFWPVIVAAIVSRGAMVYVMFALPNARMDGLSVSTGKPGLRATQVALASGTVFTILAYGLGAVWVIGAAAAAVWLMSRLANNKISGQTGDVLGATQQTAEIAILMAMCALI